MEIRLSHEDEWVFASTMGRIDDSAEAIFRKYLYPLLGQRGTKAVLDFSEARYINARGVGVLVSLVVHANKCGSRVIMACCPPFVTTVLEITKQNRFFDIAATVDDAIERLLD